jgi:hypothetical protein
VVGNLNDFFFFVLDDLAVGVGIGLVTLNFNDFAVGVRVGLVALDLCDLAVRVTFNASFGGVIGSRVISGVNSRFVNRVLSGSGVVSALS